MSGLPRSPLVMAGPLFHLKITSSPALGVVSRTSSFDLRGVVGTRQLGRGAPKQPPAPSHVSHSGQLMAVPPPQVPFVHTSPTVQGSPSSHALASGSNASAGHALLTPSQLSGASQVCVAGRQTLVLLASAGHAADVPEQSSARSHGPAAGRQTVLAGANPSGGHAALVPVHASATSQIPADARHSVPAATNPSAGQLVLVPVQASATSQGPALGRHGVPAEARLSVGHAMPV